MKNIFQVIKLAKPLYGLVFLISFLIILVTGVDIIIPFINRELIDTVGAEGTVFADLVDLILILLGVSIFSTLLTNLNQRLGDHLAGKLRRFLIAEFYKKVLTLPQSYFDSELSGRLVNQLNRGILSIKDFANTATNFILPTILQTITTIFVLFYIDIWIGLAITILFPIYYTLSYISAKKWGEYQKERNIYEDKARGRVQEAIGNIKLVKGFTSEFSEFNFIDSLQQQINKVFAKQSNNFHYFDFARNISLKIIVVIIYLLVFYNTLNGNLSIGDLVLVIQLVNRAQRPLISMSFILSRLQSAESDSEKYMEIINMKVDPDVQLRESTKDSAVIFDKPIIRFKDVNFGYSAEDTVLQDINLEFRSGETVALVGKSGAGKTTLINLIMKFYKPKSGSITINNNDFSELDTTTIRENISLVFQDNELFSGSIKENISYGTENGEYDTSEIKKALEIANAWEFVKDLPKGMDTEIGERGVRLSGGQKQRLQIARAILKNSPIVILDEATSSLDAKSELLVQDALENLTKDKLVIVIAHRFSTIQSADRIIVLDDKYVVMEGSPVELARKPGLYKDLLTYQVEGNKKLLESYEIF